MIKIFIRIFILLIFLTVCARSQEFKNIIINGNERVSNETILVFSELPNENFLDESSINDVLKKLYKSGFFNDVTVKIENNNLIIDVIENPIIQTVFLEGIKKKKIKESLKDLLSLKNRSSYNQILVKKDENTILNFLKKEGYYFSKVVSSFKDLGNNKIDLFYKIDTGKKAKISKITFIGAKKFKDNSLRKIIVSEEYKFWKIISGKKFLNENIMNYDKKLLYNFYKNKGYYNVIVESSFANYLGNDEFEIIYNISAGKKYYFNNLTLELSPNYDDENFKELKSIFSTLKGESYSINSINKILNEIDEIVLNKQYEFLKSSVTEEIVDNLINLTFDIEESEKFYVEKINIFGNNITRENVIRNELSVDEGDAFNELLHKRTLNNLRSLNFFKSVEGEIINGKIDNLKIININVEEKPTGEISAGAGIGTNGGTVVFGIKENNFLGSGVEFGTDLSFSEESVKGQVSLKNPNYKGSDRSLNFSAESLVIDRLNNFGYETNKTGITLGSGFEYYKDIFLNVGLSSYVEKLETRSNASASLKKQSGSYFDTFFDYTFAYDMRDQRFKPTDGYLSRFTQNLPLIDANDTLTSTYDVRFYDQWLNENIASYSFYASMTNSLNGKNVKLSDRLYLPSSRLRGFESGKIGPIDGSDYIGGNYALTFNANTTLPQFLPDFQNTDISLFFDAANVWGADYNDGIADGGKIRTSIGLAVDLFTPIGPLNFSFSEPITKSKNDITEMFRFNLGTSF